MNTQEKENDSNIQLEYNPIEKDLHFLERSIRQDKWEIKIMKSQLVVEENSSTSNDESSPCHSSLVGCGSFVHLCSDLFV